MFWRFVNLTCLKLLPVLSLGLFLIACSGGAGGSGAGGSGSGTTLSWTAPSERENNAALSLSDIAGYRIYYGVESGNYSNRIDVDDKAATQVSLTGVPSGAYFVVMTTIDVDGRESAFSPEIEVIL